MGYTITPLSTAEYVNLVNSENHPTISTKRTEVYCLGGDEYVVAILSGFGRFLQRFSGKGLNNKDLDKEIVRQMDKLEEKYQATKASFPTTAEGRINPLSPF